MRPISDETVNNARERWRQALDCQKVEARIVQRMSADWLDKQGSAGAMVGLMQSVRRLVSADERVLRRHNRYMTVLVMRMKQKEATDKGPDNA